jgi:hypothetical protein
LGWLRLLLAALLCAAGVARPVAARCGDAGVRRGQQPVHAAATDRRAEVVRIGARADEIAGDAPALVANLDTIAAAFGRELGVRPPRGTLPSCLPRHLSRARGPPRA